LAETSPPTLYRSNRDKGRDVEAALRADSAKSNREIARATGTSHPFVAKVRRKLESVTS
jgi:DNA-binding Lrp family transcriptional regulator